MHSRLLNLSNCRVGLHSTLYNFSVVRNKISQLECCFVKLIAIIKIICRKKWNQPAWRLKTVYLLSLSYFDFMNFISCDKEFAKCKHGCKTLNSYFWFQIWLCTFYFSKSMFHWKNQSRIIWRFSFGVYTMSYTTRVLYAIPWLEVPRGRRNVFYRNNI